jgi:hypothetical protein
MVSTDDTIRVTTSATFRDEGSNMIEPSATAPSATGSDD